MGLGAGWQEQEHEKFGWDLDTASQFERFQEGLEVITRLLRSDEPVDFEGAYYRLKEAILHRPGLPGPAVPRSWWVGTAAKRTFPMVVRYASGMEWFYLRIRFFPAERPAG